MWRCYEVGVVVCSGGIQNSGPMLRKEIQRGEFKLINIILIKYINILWFQVHKFDLKIENQYSSWQGQINGKQEMILKSLKSNF